MNVDKIKNCIFAASSFKHRQQVVAQCYFGLFLCSDTINIRRSTLFGIGNDRKPMLKGLDNGKWTPFFLSTCQNIKQNDKRSKSWQLTANRKDYTS